MTKHRQHVRIIITGVTERYLHLVKVPTYGTHEGDSEDVAGEVEEEEIVRRRI